MVKGKEKMVKGSKKVLKRSRKNAEGKVTPQGHHRSAFRSMLMPIPA